MCDNGTKSNVRVKVKSMTLYFHLLFLFREKQFIKGTAYVIGNSYTQNGPKLLLSMQSIRCSLGNITVNRQQMIQNRKKLGFLT